MSGGLSSNTGDVGFRVAVRDYGATSSTSIPDVDFAGFSPTEFMSLSESIAQNIASIKSSAQYLQKTMKMVGQAKPRNNPNVIVGVTRDRV